MGYKLVIFDCDGTLIDTVSDVVDCFNEALFTCGFTKCAFEVVASLIGKPLETIVRGLLESQGVSYSVDDVAMVSAEYKRFYAASGKPHTAPFPGMVELVDALIGDGIHVAVNSNKPELALKELVESCFPGRDLRVAGYCAERPAKPDPTGAMELAHAYGALPEETVYVGDTLVDYETAFNAHMDCVIVAWGQGSSGLYTLPNVLAVCSDVANLEAVLASDSVSRSQ